MLPVSTFSLKSLSLIGYLLHQDRETIKETIKTRGDVQSVRSRSYRYAASYARNARVKNNLPEAETVTGLSREGKYVKINSEKSIG